MLTRRLWYLEGIADDYYLGAIGEQSQLDRIERSMFFSAEDRWEDDKEILNPESQMYEVCVEHGSRSPKRATLRPLLLSEVRKVIKDYMGDDELPASLQYELDSLPQSEKGFEWEAPVDDTTIWVTVLGPANWHIV